MDTIAAALKHISDCYHGKKPQMAPVEDALTLVFPAFMQQQFLQDRKKTDIRDRGDNLAICFQLVPEPPQHPPRINQMLQYVIAYDAVKILIRQGYVINLYIADNDPVEFACSLLCHIRDKFKSPHLGLSLGFQHLSESAGPASNVQDRRCAGWNKTEHFRSVILEIGFRNLVLRLLHFHIKPFYVHPILHLTHLLDVSIFPLFCLQKNHTLPDKNEAISRGCNWDGRYR